MAGRGGGGPRTPASGGVVAVAAVPEIGGAHELLDAAMAMASRSKGLRELSTPPATVNSSVGSSACMDRAAVVARAQLGERVSSTMLLWPWWAC